mmetsp:Transcript_35856/g.57974  ORF Transcript_35856/g.57974 Transcript_35856/m.57974 type:complete len:308 (+) Transcript_35856:255-1178(+)|eukprot:CAMPEP_0184652480 /NCGR_PEP_ID=MMETSP0308-20130426/10164_1 /TAXON_ID=38269 /ORGANISM="Gloeochaete witrockiana, Strain SAG 46.84" /LENGTH=307 /DNA_ID=CAMNT_0027087373 /DNA_START=140 /DNA_END=1063 /DNA_ORIENTATION=+
MSTSTMSSLEVPHSEKLLSIGSSGERVPSIASGASRGYSDDGSVYTDSFSGDDDLDETDITMPREDPIQEEEEEGRSNVVVAQQNISQPKTIDAAVKSSERDERGQLRVTSLMAKSNNVQQQPSPSCQQDSEISSPNSIITIQSTAVHMTTIPAGTTPLIGPEESTLAQIRLEAMKSGAVLVKFAFSKSRRVRRWVVLAADEKTIRWGDPRTHKLSSSANLSEVQGLTHGASSKAFKARNVDSDPDCLCFSLLFEQRTLDFACSDLNQLLIWYLGFQFLLRHKKGTERYTKEQLVAKSSATASRKAS